MNTKQQRLSYCMYETKLLVRDSNLVLMSAAEAPVVSLFPLSGDTSSDLSCFCLFGSLSGSSSLFEALMAGVDAIVVVEGTVLADADATAAAVAIAVSEEQDEEELLVVEEGKE